MSEENRTDQRKTREMLHYDEICKHLLSYKPILARILKECVEEYHDLSYEAIQACIEPDLKGAHMHIIGRNTEDLTIPEAKILYDLLFTAALPKQKEQVALFINIEAQNRDDPSYPLLKRALYDGSRLLAGQKGEQHGFEHSSYGEIKKVYTIWLCFGHAKKKAMWPVCVRCRNTCRSAMRKRWTCWRSRRPCVHPSYGCLQKKREPIRTVRCPFFMFACARLDLVSEREIVQESR